MRACTRRALAAGVFLASAAGGAAAQDLTWTGSLGYATGNYIFTEPTRSYSLTNGLGLYYGRVRLGASLPLIYQNTSAVAFINGVPVPTGGPDSDVVRGRGSDEEIPMRGKGAGGSGSARSVGMMGGLALFQTVVADTIDGPGDYELNVGDPMFDAGFELLDGTGWVRSLEIIGAAKAPVASIESGVGTEAWDVGGGLSVAAGSGRVLLFADASYWSYGDMPDLVLEDGFSWGAGFGVAASDRVSLMASYAGMERIVPTADPYGSLAAALRYAITEGSRLTAGVGVGLSESASDVSLFVGWSTTLLRTRPPRIGARMTTGDMLAY